MSKCEFCERLEARKDADKFCEGYGVDPKLGPKHNVYTAVLLATSWYEKYGKQTASTMTYYKEYKFGFDLNYCPECGKEIK